jgi:hypothetical protein
MPQSNPVLADPPVNLAPTINLRHDPYLTRSVTVLIKEVGEAEDYTLTTVADSVAMSATLARLQQLRRFITGVYSDAKRPLAQAKKTMDVQQRALIDPLKAAEASLTAALLAFEATQETPVPVPEWEDSGALPAPLDPPVPTLVNGMGPRTNYRADVTDLKALILSVAAQLMLTDTDAAPMTKVTHRWLAAYHPTPQATSSLLQENPTALNALARALKEDLVLPGVIATAKTILVDRG